LPIELGASQAHRSRTGTHSSTSSSTRSTAEKGSAKSCWRSCLQKQARQRSCTQILFITEADRADAVAFYESAGFDSRKHVGFKRSFA
jgi:hypothetical protein